MISGTKVITHKQHTNTSCRMPNLFFQHLLTVAKNRQICNISSELYSGELWLVINYIGFPPQGISLQLTNCSGTELRNNSFIESYCLCYCYKKSPILKPSVTFSSLSTSYSINTSVLLLTIYRILFSSEKSTCTIIVIVRT